MAVIRSLLLTVRTWMSTRATLQIEIRALRGIDPLGNHDVRCGVARTRVPMYELRRRQRQVFTRRRQRHAFGLRMELAGQSFERIGIDIGAAGTSCRSGAAPTRA